MSDSIVNALITSHFLPADIKKVIVLIEEKRLKQLRALQSTQRNISKEDRRVIPFNQMI